MNIKFCCIGSGVVVAGIGIALIVLSSLVVNFVNHRIDDGVKDKLRVAQDFGSWSQEDIDDWKDYNVNYTYYVWNLTNHDAAVFGGARPSLQAVGPFYIREENHRFNITWDELPSTNPVGTVVSYNEWWQKVWTDDAANADVNNKQKPVTAINLPYFGVMGAIKAQTGSDNKESVFLRNTIAAVVDFVGTTLLSDSGSFVNSVRASSFRAFLSYALGAAPNGAGVSSGQWAAGPTLSTGALTCLELTSPDASGGAANASYGITDPATINNLLNETSDLSLVSATGSQTWAMSLTNTTIRALLVNVYGQDTYSKVVRWILLLITPTSYCYTTYQPTTVGIMAAQLSCSGATTFSDLGACQFGTGAVTRSFGSNSIMANSVEQQQLCGAINNIGAANLGFTCVGPEFYAFSQANCGVANHTLTVAEAKAFLNAFKTMGTAPNNPNACTTVPYTGVRGVLTQYGLLAAVLPTNDTTAIGNVIALINATFSSTGLTSARVTGQCILKYLTYAGKFYGLIGNVVLRNGGIFTTRAPAEIFLGYPSAPYNKTAPFQTFNDPVFTTLNRTWSGCISSYSSAADLLAVTATPLAPTGQRRYRYYTGTDDISKANMYQAWRGSATIQKPTDIYAACPCTTFDACNGSCIMNPYSAATCANIWGEPEILDVTSDAGNFAPFREGADPYVVFKVFLSEALRVLNFTYVADTEVKGIKARRYALQTTHLDNQTYFRANANYKMTGPNGMVWMTDWQNAPVYLSRPHFWQVNNEVKLPFTSDSFLPNGTEQDDGADGFFTYVDVEPLSGATIRGHKRLQLSVKLSTDMFDSGFYSKVLNNGIFDTDSNTTKVIYWPLYWGDQNGVIKDKDASSFRTKIYDNRKLADRLEIAGYVVGAFLTFIGVLAVVYGIMKGRAEAGPTRMESTPNLSNM